MTAASSLPGVWRLAWMLFMQPILLHRELIAWGIQPDAPGWRLWRTGGIHRQYVIRLMISGLLLLLLIHLILIIIQFGIGSPIDWGKLAGGVAFGVAGRVAVGVAFGVAGSVAVGGSLIIPD